MPTSHYCQISKIMELILLAEPESILDIGVGFGKYGLLSREYLEYWGKSEDYDDWKITIDGVEIYQDYIKDHHYDIYSNIYIGDVTELLPTLPRYDLILFIDVLEHLDFEDGIRLLQECSQRCRNMIIATPRDIVEQEDVFENPYETHRTQWRRKHFRMFKDRFFIHYPFVMIYFIGDDCDRVKHLHSQGRKDRMMSLGGSYLPFLRKPHNSFRKMLKRS